MTRVGQVLGAYGVEGAVKVLSLTDFDERFRAGAVLVLEGGQHRVQWSRESGGGLVVKLEGIDNRTVAELYRGRYLEISTDAVRGAGEGRYYHHQLIGLTVATESGEELGRIAEILERPANDVWVSREGTVEHLIPATRDAVVAVDLDAGRVVVADWLLVVEEA